MDIKNVGLYSYCQDLPTQPDPEKGTILVTGASGYIGGRLVPELLARNYKVRVMVRAASPEQARRWPEAEIVVADALDRAAVEKALEGVDTVFYLIHSLLLGPKDFASADLVAAEHFRIAAGKNHVKRMIYLGGLGDNKTDLSAHLRSRILVAQELQKGAVPVTILRAAIIIGSGSASYEIINSLVRSLPVIPIPFWARTRCQPISIRDVIKYLVGCLETPGTAGRSFDIGGNEILTYEKMMRTLADLIGKKRLFIPSPVSHIGFFSYVANLITPVPNAIARCLMEGSVNEVICQNDDIKDLIPFEPLSFRDALERAATRESQDNVHTRWSDAYPPGCELPEKLSDMQTLPQYTSMYAMETGKAPEAVFRSICSIGGREGWFHGNWLWRLRGWLDRIMTGVGTSRGRRSHSSLRINDVIDFWRVEELEENRLLVLRAEMLLPGQGWLQFKIDDADSARSTLSVKAFFYTNSVGGKLYWYACLPFHQFIFKNLIRQIEKRS